jgi:hypothetical protein
MSIALTLPLSPRRGNRSFPHWETLPKKAESTGVQKLLPLLGGEGRGEGESFIALNRYG